MDPASSTVPFSIQKIADQTPTLIQVEDLVAVEEPLEIRLEWQDGEGNQVKKTVSITMRTPGNDFDLALGFLFTEGILRNRSEVEEIRHCGPVLNLAQSQNIVLVRMKRGLELDLSRLERHFYTSSSCGVCGKASIEALRIQSPYSSKDGWPQTRWNAMQISQFPEVLRRAQTAFNQTGGLHASGLFSANGELLIVREDVGRHNALDKLIGHCFANNQLPLNQSLLLVSGRASFELIQKASMAGIPTIAAVGAPSSLAVELARELDLTLLGFVKPSRLNIYHEGP